MSGTMTRTQAAMLIAVQGMKVDPFDKEQIKKATKLALEVLDELESSDTMARLLALYANRKRVIVKGNMVHCGDRGGSIWPGVVRLMEYLYTHKGVCIGIEEIKTSVIGSTQRTNHAVYSLVSSLRNAIGDDVVLTHHGRGGGYQWNADYELVSE